MGEFGQTVSQTYFIITWDRDHPAGFLAPQIVYNTWK